MPVGKYKRSKHHLDLLAKARQYIIRKPLTEETKEKISKSKRNQVYFNCDYCGKESSDKPSSYNKKQRHFCCRKCYSDYRGNYMKPNEQPSWKGGITSYESHKKWKEKNPERMAHLKARRYAREKGAKGRHTLSEWEKLKEKNNYKCAFCGERKKLTKDHIVPLSEGGSDYIENIQPLCKNCNSRKWKYTDLNIYENPDLLEVD